MYPLRIVDPTPTPAPAELPGGGITRPPIPFLDTVSTFFGTIAVVGIIATIVLLIALVFAYRNYAPWRALAAKVTGWVAVVTVVTGGVALFTSPALA